MILIGIRQNGKNKLRDKRRTKKVIDVFMQ